MTNPTIIRDESHVYRVDGVVRPSVTQIIRWGGLTDYSDTPTEKQEFAMHRGTVVHDATVLVDELSLDWDSLDRRARPYVQAYQSFCIETCFQTILCEHPFYSPFGYCGTLDRMGKLGDGSRVVLDLKTGMAIPKTTGVQLAAYVYGLPNPLTYRRFAVRLGKDANYSMKEYPKSELSADWAAFMSALVITNWKKNHGYKI